MADDLPVDNVASEFASLAVLEALVELLERKLILNGSDVRHLLVVHQAAVSKQQAGADKLRLAVAHELNSIFQELNN